MPDYLSTVKPRSEIIAPSETVVLKAMFRGPDGNPTDLDAFPTVTIVQPSGNVAMGPTSAGVYRISEGVYGFDYLVGLNPSVGVWTDVWQGTLGGNFVGGSFNFVIHTMGQIPAVNSDGYIHLGDEPKIFWSQNAINNLNLLLKTLRARLGSDGMTVSKDSFGNKSFVQCSIFGVDNLVSFLVASLSLFNSISHFTLYSFEDTEFIGQFHEIIVQGALVYALSSKMLLERGREYNVSDNGISFQLPTVSELMSSWYNTELTNWTENVKLIKGNMKPAPLGLGTMAPIGGNRTVYKMLASQRARRII